MVAHALTSAAFPQSFCTLCRAVQTDQADYQRAVLKKDATIGKLRQANYRKIADLPTATVITGAAQFVDNHTLTIQMKDGSNRRQSRVNASLSIQAPSQFGQGIIGLKDQSAFVYTTETLMAKNLTRTPCDYWWWVYCG